MNNGAIWFAFSECKASTPKTPGWWPQLQRHGVTHILTFNVADFRAFPGITVIDPTGSV